MKKSTARSGIAMVTLISMVVIIAVLATTVAITGTGAVNSAKKNALAQELMLLQNAVNSYYTANSTLPVDNQVTMDLSAVNDTIRADQFAGENIVSNNITLYIVDLKAAGIDSVTRGTRKNGDKDIYAVSETTRKVYYVAGEKISGTTYYTLNSDLKGLIKIQTGTSNSNVTDGVTFTSENTNYTNVPIKSKVMVPNTYQINGVTGTNGVLTAVDNTNTVPGYVVYNVNTTNIAVNYTVNVTYTKDGATKQASFNVENFDNVSPNLSVGTQAYIKDDIKKETRAFINNVVANDALSGIKYIKYESERIATGDMKNYFINSGKTVSDNLIPLEPKQNYTIYVEDKAGNSTYVYVTIEKGIIDAINSYNK